MFCGHREKIFLIFAVCATLYAFDERRGDDGSNEREKGGVREASASPRAGTFWRRRRREGAGQRLETNGAPGSPTYERPGLSSEPRSEGPGRHRATRRVAAPQQLEDTRPEVECGSDMMTVTAKGGGRSHLLIARENGPPLSFLELPSSCGYSVKVTWQDLTLKAPYDGCYVVKENGNYVLRLVWFGVPVEMSCPSLPTPPRRRVSASCLPFGISLKIKGQHAEAGKLGLKLNGKWVPSASAPCVYRIEASKGEVVLYLPYSVCDLPVKDGAYTLSVLLDESERIISCPAMTSPQFPQHLALNYPFYYKPPHPPATAPTVRQTQSLELPYFYPTVPVSDPVAKLPDQSLYPTLHLPAYPPSSVLSLNVPHLPVKHYYPVMHMFYPFLLANSPTLPLAFSHYNNMLPMFYPYHHLPVPQSSASKGSILVPTTTEPPAVPNYVALTPTPSLTLDHKPYMPVACRPRTTLGMGVDSYDSILSIRYPQQTPESYLDCAGPSFPLPSLTQLPGRSQTVVLSSSPDLPTPAPRIEPTLVCLTNVMTVKLPSAHPDSLQVTDSDDKWVPISTVPSSCDYKLATGDGRGVILTTPFPACHTRNLPSARSFLLMFWDTVLGQHRTLELRCPTPSPLRVSSRPVHPSMQIPTGPSLLKPPPFSNRKVFCSAHDMRVELPPGPIWGISVKDVDGGAVRLKNAPKRCGYDVSKGRDGINTLILPFDSCHMTVQGNEHKIHLKFRTHDGQEDEATFSCLVHPLVTKPAVPTPTVLHLECSHSIEKRILCGPKSCSRDECDSLGCCFSSSSKMCYYPMDECSVDHHFVFSVPASITDPPLNPASLFVASNTSCTPQMVTSSFALFKIPLVGCGAHRYEIGQTVVYMLEILNTVQSITIGYGTITRDSPLRLLVECRFVPGSQISVGYLVKTPSLGPSIQAHGTFGVQLRIATDEHYTNYYPQYHRPLRLLLGKPLHLEVRLLNPPDPNLVLLVHYCLAYPRSAQAAWVLIYDGCPNRLDSTPKQPLAPPAPVPNQTRRFTITTFQFLSPDDHTQLDEEIYFMCSTEVCSPSEGPCIEGCFTNGDQSLTSVKS